jgi:hypothetical protein
MQQTPGIRCMRCRWVWPLGFLNGYLRLSEWASKTESVHHHCCCNDESSMPVNYLRLPPATTHTQTPW